MGIGASIFLLALGAILSFAVNTDVNGIDLDTIGVILMLLGAGGLLFALVLWNDDSPWRRRLDRTYEDVAPPTDRERIIYRDEPPVERERVVYRDSRV